MSEIAVLLQQRGLSPEMAAEADTAIIQLIESRVPAPMQGVVASLLGGAAPGSAPEGTPAAEGAIEGLLGGFFK